MTKDEALKLALEALEEAADAIDSWGSYASGYFQVKHDLEGDISKAKSAITAIREALAQPEQICGLDVVLDESMPPNTFKLAQPEQEPVVWMYQDKTSHAVKFQRHMSNFVDHSKTSEIPLYSEPLANHELQCVCGAVWCGDEMVHLPNKIPPQPEPVIDKSAAVRIATSLGWEPKRKWVGLTDDEIIDVIHPLVMADMADEATDYEIARAIEAKLKEKNT